MIGLHPKKNSILRLPFGELFELFKNTFLSIINMIIILITSGRSSLNEGLDMFGRYYMWNKHHSFSTQVHYPESYKELAMLVRTCKKFRIVGAGCSCNDIIESDTLISLEHFNKIISVDSDHITVQAGMSLNRLVEYLDKIDRSIDVISLNTSISIGGAIANGAHISGRDDQISFFSDMIKEITVMTTKGQIIKLKNEKLHQCRTCIEKNCSNDSSDYRSSDSSENRSLLHQSESSTDQISTFNRSGIVLKDNFKDGFNAVINGMGLTGIIIEAKIAHCTKEYYRITHKAIRYIDLPDALVDFVKSNERCVIHIPIQGNDLNDVSVVTQYNKTQKPLWIVEKYYKIIKLSFEMIQNCIDVFIIPYLSYLRIGSLNNLIFRIVPRLSLVVSVSNATKVDVMNSLGTEFSIDVDKRCAFDIINDIRTLSREHYKHHPHSVISMRFSGTHQNGLLNPGALKPRCTNKRCGDGDIDVLDPQDGYICSYCDMCSRSDMKGYKIWISIATNPSSKTEMLQQDIIKIAKKYKAKFNTGMNIGYSKNIRIDRSYMNIVYGGTNLDRFTRVRRLLDPGDKLSNEKEIV